MIKTNAYLYSLRIEGCDTNELCKDAYVVFVARSRPNDKNPDKDFLFTTDVKLKEDQ